ncbi:MAG: hypothetical protein ACYCX2_06175 [Christensenellales bacterium]
MKKLFMLFAAIMLLMFTAGVTNAFAGTSISGPSTVEAGKTYKYTITVSANASTIQGKVSCEGVFSGSSADFWEDSSGVYSDNISATVSITVTVASGTAPGSQGTITVKGNGTTVDQAGNDGSFVISGSKTATVVVKTPAPSKSSKPRTPSPSTPTPSPTATPQPTQWDLAALSVDGMNPGGTINLDITENTQIPVPLLTSLSGKQGILNINFGGYSCTIDGSSLRAIPDGIAAIDLGLTMETDPALSAAAGGADVYQLHFSHEGQFPGVFSFTFKAEKSKPGDTVYLYYYYGQANIIEGKATATVGANGYATFGIYHCSDYFVANTIMENAFNNFPKEDTGETEKIAELQKQNSALETQLQAIKDSQETAATQAAAAPLYQLEAWIKNLSLIEIAAGLVAAVLLSMFFTMLFCRAGIFRRKPAPLKAAASDIAEEVSAPDGNDVDRTPPSNGESS